MSTISIDGLKEAQKTFQKLDENFQEDLLKEVTQKAYEKSKEYASEHHVTGELERSVFHRFYKSKNEGVIGAKAPHAIFVHFGTKPHVIKPKEKKSLRWAGPKGFIFRKKVYHPGYKGDPFIYRGIEETFKRIDQIKEDILKDY